MFSAVDDWCFEAVESTTEGALTELVEDPSVVRTDVVSIHSAKVLDAGMSLELLTRVATLLKEETA